MELKEPRKKYQRVSHGHPDKVRLIALRDKKVVYSIKLEPLKLEKLTMDIERLEKNPEKITLWKEPTPSGCFEIFTYQDLKNEKWFLAHEDDWIIIDKYRARRLFGVVRSLCNYLGLNRRKRGKNQ